jgi:hypothetical protein
VALGCDESGRFEPCIGEDRRGIKSPTKAYVWDRFLVGWIVAFAVAAWQLSVEVIMSSSTLTSGMAEVCSPECDRARP